MRISLFGNPRSDDDDTFHRSLDRLFPNALLSFYPINEGKAPLIPIYLGIRSVVKFVNIIKRQRTEAVFIRP